MINDVCILQTNANKLNVFYVLIGQSFHGLITYRCSYCFFQFVLRVFIFMLYSDKFVEVSNESIFSFYISRKTNIYMFFRIHCYSINAIKQQSPWLYVSKTQYDKLIFSAPIDLIKLIKYKPLHLSFEYFNDFILKCLIIWIELHAYILRLKSICM